MSIDMHFRAVPAEEIQEDFNRLTEFMLAAWDKHSEEYASGVSTSISKAFSHVNDFFTKGSDRGSGPSGPSLLPVYGGRHIEDPAHIDLGFLILDPDQVRVAAEFLQTPFDTLWKVDGAQLYGWNEAEMKHFHFGLRAFYQRAASAGHAVIKVVWA
ncbi:hypothetical protein GCM10020367_62580 [Streptomyces sannanensis]|uniref:DUF1877 family protein n=1 Tax=Streptomyces sannanensis TaxID=285536 RepID=A0ABP6SLN9_9ACTN